MDSLDTNILARYYVVDAGDGEAGRQREVARQIVDAGTPLFIAKTVVLELEWVLRGYYRAKRDEVVAVLRHLLSLPHAEIEDRDALTTAVELMAAGFDCADALHHASSRQCDRLLTFDDRGFARRAERYALQPRVRVPPVRTR